MRLYTAGTVVVGDGRVLRDAGVLVDGTTIVDVGPRASLVGSAITEQVDAPTGAVLPGLIDTHVHLAFEPDRSVRASVQERSAHETLLGMAGHAAELLEAGVTSVRDLGAPGLLDVAVKRAVADGSIRGPRVVTAGRPLTPTGGHCWFLGGECDDDAAVRRTIRQQRRDGVDLVKVMATGGASTRGSRSWRSQYSTDALRTVVSEAHDGGQRVAAHAHGAEGIGRAVAAGVDTLEHATWQTECDFDGYDAGVADAIAAEGIAVCGTFTAAGLDHPEFVEPRCRAVEDMRRRGVAFVAGTDAGTAGIRHGAFAAGLSTMARYGFPAAEVLVAATGAAADAVGLAEVTGRLAPGLAADLLVLDHDPLVDLGALAAPRRVVAGGREIPR